MNRKYIAVILSLIVLCSALAGCSNNSSVTLFDTDSIKVEQIDHKTIITDKATTEVYSFTSKKIATKKTDIERIQKQCFSNTVCNSDTLKIDIVYNMVVVLVKQENKTYYIKSR